MPEATTPPHQITYEDICKHTGRLYLELTNEIERLKAMLLDLQCKYVNLTEENTQLQKIITKQ